MNTDDILILLIVDAVIAFVAIVMGIIYLKNGGE